MPATALGSVGGVANESAGTPMTSAKGPPVAVCAVGVLESVTEIATEYVPPKPVVPLIKPVEGLIERPRGSPVTLHMNGCVPPDVIGWKLYGVLVIPAGI